MSSNCLRRVQKELGDIANDTEAQIFAEPGSAHDLTHLRARFPGPPDTPYEGGTFVVDVQIPNDYPFKPPVMKFVTKLWHPNVSSQTVSPPFGVEEEKLIWIGSYLFRYFRVCLVAGTHHKSRSSIPSISTQHARTKRSTRCGSSKHVDEQSSAISESSTRMGNQACRSTQDNEVVGQRSLARSFTVQAKIPERKGRGAKTASQPVCLGLKLSGVLLTPQIPGI
jgi:ubiquitin-conjugating enzyme (huntingtin interacting protein 2)